MFERWVKTYEKILDWEWSNDPYVFTFFVKLTLLVNVSTKRWHGRTIKRGQLLTSMRNLEERFGWSHHTIQRVLDDLQSTGEISVESDKAGTLITIINFSKYQGEGVANTATPSATPSATNIRIEEYKNEERKNEELFSTPLPPEGETAKKKEKKPKEPPHAVTEYDKAFEAIYSKHTGTPFAWSKRENIACNSIVGKIAAVMVAQGQVPTNDSKLEAFKWFVDKVATKGDDWMRANLTPHVIDSKFNEYYQRIKSQENGTARNNNQNPYGVSPEYLENLARELGGVL